MLQVENIELTRLKTKIGYKGCKNCLHQIEPLRMCEWAESGGDGHIHLLCPRWENRDKYDGHEAREYGKKCIQEVKEEDAMQRM